jgi:hypothetical protein
MIRINLIGQKAKPKPTASRGQLLVFLALLLVEAGFLFVWHQKLSSELTDATKRSKDASAKIEELKKVKEAWEQWQAQKADLDRQAQVFETLQADQVGPPSVLQYIGYMLTKLPDTPSSADEMKAQELVGWNPKWDARRVWIRRYSEKSGVLTLNGEALDHEDVAEFYRRMESSDYFSHVEPGLQTRKVHVELGIKYVEFTVTAVLNYRVALETQGAPGETVPAIEGAAGATAGSPAPVAAPAAAPAATPGAAAGPGAPSEGPGVPSK